MIQRKQTVFLLLAIAALVACICLPIGTIEPKGMGVPMVWDNMALYADTAIQMRPLPFVDLAIAVMLSLIAIFLYKKRKLQARLCSASMVLCLAWYVYVGICVLNEFQSSGRFHVAFAACLPFVAFVLLVMARKGVMADERLVRSMDRIR